MKNLPVFISCFIFTIIMSCKKEEVIVNPQAKMYADKIIVNKGDTVTFTNTSVAEYAAIFVSRAGEEDQGTHIGYSFEQNHTNTYKHVFTDTGSFVAKLQVNNEKSIISYFKIPITVNP